MKAGALRRYFGNQFNFKGPQEEKEVINETLIIQASVDEQKHSALVTSYFRCSREFELVLEDRIFDAAGNMSEPVTVTFSCPAPKPYISPWLVIGYVIGLALLGLAIWLLVRYRRSRRVAASLE